MSVKIPDGLFGEPKNPFKSKLEGKRAAVESKVKEQVQKAVSGLAPQIKQITEQHPDVNVRKAVQDAINGIFEG